MAPLRSMTGFGAGKGASGGEELAVEVRAVNHKYCEVKVRLPRELSALEPELVRQVREALHRGAVEVSVHRTPGARPALEVKVDLPLAREYMRVLRDLGTMAGVDGKVSAVDLAGLEGVVSVAERPADVESARQALKDALAGALGQVVAMREAEGEALGRDLAARLDTLDRAIAELQALVPRVVEQHRSRMAARLAELVGGAPLEPARILQEAAIFADRADVSEELSRLASHIAQARALLASHGPAGRRLDFLVQEMHREVNTLGSKAQSAEVSARVVEMKAEVEKLREQVQNVE